MDWIGWIGKWFVCYCWGSSVQGRPVCVCCDHVYVHRSREGISTTYSGIRLHSEQQQQLVNTCLYRHDPSMKQPPIYHMQQAFGSCFHFFVLLWRFSITTFRSFVFFFFFTNKKKRKINTNEMIKKKKSLKMKLKAKQVAHNTFLRVPALRLDGRNVFVCHNFLLRICVPCQPNGRMAEWPTV